MQAKKVHGKEIKQRRIREFQKHKTWHVYFINILPKSKSKAFVPKPNYTYDSVCILWTRSYKMLSEQI